MAAPSKQVQTSSRVYRREIHKEEEEERFSVKRRNRSLILGVLGIRGFIIFTPIIILFILSYVSF